MGIKVTCLECGTSGSLNPGYDKYEQYIKDICPQCGSTSRVEEVSTELAGETVKGVCKTSYGTLILLCDSGVKFELCPTIDQSVAISMMD